jgi:hypothetical protein
MKGILRATTVATALALVVTTACDPGEDRIDQAAQDTLPAERAQVSQVNLQQVRADVDSVMSELRAELEEMRTQVREDRTDRWTEFTADVDETRGEVMEDLRRADTADRDEAERIRERTAERLAELEADAARNQIVLLADTQTLEQRVDRHVQRLQSDIEYLQNQLREYQARDRDDDSWFDFTNGLDQEDIADWQEELAEVQADLRERTAEDDDVEDIASDLGDRVADLTRDIREYVHALQWGAYDRVD